MDEVLTIGAVDREFSNQTPPLASGRLSHCDSSRGPGQLAVKCPKPDFVAPTYGEVPWGEGFRQLHWWGTSGAAPQVSGLCALLLEKNPDLSTDHLRSIIAENCISTGPASCVGAGVINCRAAIDGMD